MPRFKNIGRNHFATIKSPIDAMDQLKSGIGLRGLGGQDPAAAYAQEGFDMFEAMIEAPIAHQAKPRPAKK